MTSRRPFGPVVLLGLASAGLTALAASKPWARIEGTAVVPHAVAEAGRSPLAGALSLVLLAAWGVVLVTRGQVRRAVALLGLLAALGVLACVVIGATGLTDDLMSAVREAPRSGAEVSAGRTGWLWVAGLSALVATAATAVAAAWAPHWHSMSRKYDAPGAGEPVPPADADSLDLWKSMDEGHDPTR